MTSLYLLLTFAIFRHTYSKPRCAPTSHLYLQAFKPTPDVFYMFLTATKLQISEIEKKIANKIFYYMSCKQMDTKLGMDVTDSVNVRNAMDNILGRY